MKYANIETNHIGIDHDDSMMIFQDRSCKGNKFHDRVFHDPIHIWDCDM